MLTTLVLSAVTVAYPRVDQTVPFVSRCYAIGATAGAETSLVVRVSSTTNSIRVPVTATGAWAAMMPVSPGTNVLEIGDCRRSFVVEAPTPPSGSAGAKRYSKLPYSGDEPKPPPKGRPPSAITIVLDPGHGGSDSGAISPHGLPEKDANLRLAKAIRDELSRRGFRTVLTREDDSFPALYDRPKVAHRERADAFVSIHHNAPGAATDPSVTRYQSVYAWNEIGERLAQAIEKRMAAAVPTLASRGVLHANFAVTRNPEIPSCLVEADFVTSPEGEADVWDPDRRAVQAAAIAAGIADWATGEVRRP